MTKMGKQSLMVGPGLICPPGVSNDELSEFVDTDDGWIKQRTGISQRHIVAEDEKTSIWPLMPHRPPLPTPGYQPLISISSLSRQPRLMIPSRQQPLLFSISWRRIRDLRLMYRLYVLVLSMLWVWANP